MKGKEFVDFLLDFLTKEVDTGVKRILPKLCKNELTPENAIKLRQVFSNENKDELALYFNAKNGMKVLVESLQFNLEALPILNDLLADKVKLQEEF